MKKIIQMITSSAITIAAVFFINTTNIYAQSGEGVDGCNYYWNYGFKNAESCRKWLDYKENSSRPYWTAKLTGCMVFAAGFTAAEAEAMMLNNITQAIVTLGGTFIGCMF